MSDEEKHVWGDRSDGSLSGPERRLIQRAVRAKWDIPQATLDTLRQKLGESAARAESQRDITRLSETVDKLMRTDLAIDEFEDKATRLDTGKPTENRLVIVIEPHDRSTPQSAAQTD